jgi:1-acyl-sn-glycerol-3-phosphate acyltransferase
MWILTQIKAIVVALGVLLFILLPPCILALPFPLRIRLKIVSPAWVFGSKLMLRFGCQSFVDIQRDERSQQFKGTPPYGLYVANHQSFVDIPLITTMYQAPPIMKKEILRIPIFGWLGWISGAMPVSRSKVHSRKKVFDQAKERILTKRIGIQVYPEGTRSRDTHPKSYDQIKRTLLVFAYNEKIPVIPTSLYGTRGVINSRGFIRPGRHLGVIVHQELLPENFKNSEEFCRAVWDKVIGGYEELMMKLGPLNEN